MDLERVASRELVEQLWEDVRRREAVLTSLPAVEAPELSRSIVLRFLNLHWRAEPIQDPYGSSRRVKHRAASRLTALVVHVLAAESARQEAFRANLVRMQNEVAEAHDQLVREVRLLRGAIEDRTAQQAERVDTLARQFDERIAALEQRAAPSP